MVGAVRARYNGCRSELKTGRFNWNKVVQKQFGPEDKFIRFLYIVIGSSAELETQLLLVEEIGLLNKSIDESKEKLQEVIKMLHGLIRSLKRVEGLE